MHLLAVGVFSQFGLIKPALRNRLIELNFFIQRPTIRYYTEAQAPLSPIYLTQINQLPLINYGGRDPLQLKSSLTYVEMSNTQENPAALQQEPCGEGLV